MSDFLEEDVRRCFLCGYQEDVHYNGTYLFAFENGNSYEVSGLTFHAVQSKSTGGHGYLPPDVFLEDMSSTMKLCFFAYPGGNCSIAIGNLAGSFRFNLYPAHVRARYPHFARNLALALEKAEQVRCGELPSSYSLECGE